MSATRCPRPSRRPPFRCCWPVATCSGQAQTGTGKTAAFALPHPVDRIDLATGTPQALVLAPTRELAIQVAEAFQRYAAHLPGFHVLPIYGGQAMDRSCRPCSAACMSSWARRAASSTTWTRGRCDLSRHPHAGARRGRRDAAHGLHRRRRADPAAHAADAPDRAVLGHHAGRDQPHRQDLPARSASRSRSPPGPPPPTTSASATGW